MAKETFNGWVRRIILGFVLIMATGSLGFSAWLGTGVVSAVERLSDVEARVKIVEDRKTPPPWLIARLDRMENKIDALGKD